MVNQAALITDAALPALTPIAALPAPRSPEHTPPQLSPARERLRQTITQQATIARDAAVIGEKASRLRRVLDDDVAATARLEECRRRDQEELARWYADGQPIGRPQPSAETEAAEEQALRIGADAVAIKTLLPNLENEAQHIALRQKPIVEEKQQAMVAILLEEIAPALLVDLAAAIDRLVEADCRMRALTKLLRSENFGAEGERLDQLRTAAAKAAPMPDLIDWARQQWLGLSNNPAFEINND